MNERAEALLGLVVARGEAAILLEPVEEDLDEVTLLEYMPVVIWRRPSAWIRPNDGGYAARDELVTNAVRVVRGVSKEDIAVRVIDQLFCNDRFVCLAWGELDVDRLTESVHESVDLGGKTSARPANSVPGDPPFPPAACW